jgi:hypothetical protein
LASGASLARISHYFSLSVEGRGFSPALPKAGEEAGLDLGKRFDSKSTGRKQTYAQTIPFLGVDGSSGARQRTVDLGSEGQIS